MLAWRQLRDTMAAAAAVAAAVALRQPRQIRKYLSEYQQIPERKNSSFPFYDFLKEKLEIEGYWKKISLA
jgi:hypothetical protein